MLGIGEKPLGKYFVLAVESNYKLERGVVNPIPKLFYQLHHKGQEQCIIIDGELSEYGYGEDQ